MQPSAHTSSRLATVTTTNRDVHHYGHVTVYVRTTEKTIYVHVISYNIQTVPVCFIIP